MQLSKFKMDNHNIKSNFYVIKAFNTQLKTKKLFRYNKEGLNITLKNIYAQ